MTQVGEGGWDRYVTNIGVQCEMAAYVIKVQVYFHCGTSIWREETETVCGERRVEMLRNCLWHLSCYLLLNDGHILPPPASNFMCMYVAGIVILVLLAQV